MDPQHLVFLKGVTARIDGFDGPHHLAFGRDGRLLYIGNLGADRVSVVDVASAQIVQQIELGEVPDGAGTEPTAERGGVQSITLSADGRRGFVTFGGDDGLTVVDLTDQRVLKRLTLGELSRRAYATGDGRHIVVPNDGDDTISIVDTATLGELARVPGALVISGVSMGWFETTAFVFARTQRQAIVIDLEHGARVDTIRLPGRPETGVTTPDGAKLYVALGDRDSVAVIDTRAHRLMTVIDGVGGSPWSAQMIGTLNYCH